MDTREEGGKEECGGGSEGDILPQVSVQKRKKKREVERQKKRRKTRMRKEKAVEEKQSKKEVYIRGTPTFLTVDTISGFSAKAHFLPKLFCVDKVGHLGALLRKEEQFWELKEDARRLQSNNKRNYFTAGRRAAQGHSRAGIDPVHWARPGGDISKLDPELLLLLAEFSAMASNAVEKYRPEMSEILRRSFFSDIFGLFHIFFAVEGAVKLHRDPNDFISFIFPIEMESNAGGGLEIGGTSLCFQAKVGDATLVDSDLLLHGVRKYQGDPSARLVGVFAIQKSYLRLKGVPFE